MMLINMVCPCLQVKKNYMLLLANTPSSISRPTKTSWVGVTDNIKKKFASWKDHLLSPQGRTELIRSYCWSVPNYWSPIQSFQKCVQSSAMSFCSKFLWKGQLNQKHILSPLAWPDVTFPISQGGLGLWNLKVNS